MPDGLAVLPLTTKASNSGRATLRPCAPAPHEPQGSTFRNCRYGAVLVEPDDEAKGEAYTLAFSKLPDITEPRNRLTHQHWSQARSAGFLLVPYGSRVGVVGIVTVPLRPDKRLLFGGAQNWLVAMASACSSSTRPPIRPFFVYGHVLVLAVNCSFINNGASDLEYGGALAVSGTVTVMLDGCTFANNTAKTGAAVWSQVGSRDKGALAITQCIFTGNRGQVRHHQSRLYVCLLLSACRACIPS